MTLLNGKLFAAAGVVLMLGGLLAFSLASPNSTVGQETDVPVPDVEDPGDGFGDDVDSGTTGPTDPPASLPDTGNGGYLASSGESHIMLLTLLTAAGLAIASAGAVMARRAERGTDR